MNVVGYSGLEMHRAIAVLAFRGVQVILTTVCHFEYGGVLP